MKRKLEFVLTTGEALFALWLIIFTIIIVGVILLHGVLLLADIVGILAEFVY